MADEEDMAYERYQAMLRAAGAECYRCGMPVEWRKPMADYPEWCVVDQPPPDQAGRGT